MFKKILLAIAIALPMSAAAQAKFGVIDMNPVFEALPETAAMKAQLLESQKKYEDELKNLQDEIDKLYTEFQTLEQDPNTPQSIKERRMQDIQDRYQKVQQFRNTAQEDLGRQQQQLTAPIEQKIMDAIKAVGTEGGYTFIFPNEQMMILYKGADVTDVTPAVRTKLGLK